MSLDDTVIHGARIRLHPNDDQAAQFDIWRRRCRSLWNLLLGIEQAAYSGEKFRPELKWRQKWVFVAGETVQKRQASYEAGKRQKPPEPLTRERIEKMLGRCRAAGEMKLFLWEDELLKVMARLKQEPLGQWINDIHSHAAQQVAKEVVFAIRTMLSERKKKAAGQNARDAGFPRFKKTSAYAEGSVYFANTQLEIDRKSIKFPWGIGKIPMGDMAHIPDGAKLMNGRLFREGDTWWLSAQFQFAAPDALPGTGRECGLKVSATIIATTIDGEGNIHQVRMPVESARHAFQMNLSSKSLSRRNRRTKAYRKEAAKLAYQHAGNRNVRDDCLHKTSRAIIDTFDAISIQKMDVANLQRKSGEKGAKHLRKLNKSAAMSRFRTIVAYKAKEGGRVYHETHRLFPEVQVCSTCGKLHDMPLSKQVLKCECGTRLERRVNAAQNEFDQLQIAKIAAE